jgi:hypothetical protein
VGERRGVYRILVEKPKRGHLGDTGINGGIILRKWDWTGLDRGELG